MKRWLSFFLALSVLMFSAQAGDDLVSSQMVDEAREWSQKGRDDLAAQVWRKLLRVETRHPEALVKLGLIEARAGNTQEAQALYQRASRLEKPPRGLKELSAALTTTPAAAPAAAPAPPQVKAVPTQALPTPTLPVASLNANPTPNSGTDHWDETRRRLEQQAQQHPSDTSYLIALANHLAQREATRREAIRQLEALYARGLRNAETKRTWRTALLALTPRPGDQALLSNYLAISPGSISINQRVKELGGKASNQTQSKKGKASSGAPAGPDGASSDTATKPVCGNSSCK